MADDQTSAARRYKTSQVGVWPLTTGATVRHLGSGFQDLLITHKSL